MAEIEANQEMPANLSLRSTANLTEVAVRVGPTMVFVELFDLNPDRLGVVPKSITFDYYDRKAVRRFAVELLTAVEE